MTMKTWDFLAQVTELPNIPIEATGATHLALIAIITLLLSRVLPKLGEDHKAGLHELASEVKDMGDKIASKIDEGNREHASILRQALMDKKPDTRDEQH